MPKYSYECENCGKQKDFVHAMDETLEGKQKCYFCAKRTLRKLPSYYTTLFRGDEEKKPKVGAVVVAAIEEMKEDLRQYKEKVQEVVVEEIEKEVDSNVF